MNLGTKRFNITLLNRVVAVFKQEKFLSDLENL